MVYLATAIVALLIALLGVAGYTAIRAVGTIVQATESFAASVTMVSTAYASLLQAKADDLRASLESRLAEDPMAGYWQAKAALDQEALTNATTTDESGYESEPILG